VTSDNSPGREPLARGQLRDPETAA